MAKNDELPPMGLPLVERSSTGYFFGVIGMVIVCGAAVLAIGYGSLRLSGGPCDALYGEALDGLRAEVEFFRRSGTALGVSKAEIQDLRAGTQVAQESLEACCEQRQEGSISEDVFQECRAHASVIEALPAELAAAHGDPAAAKQVIRTAAGRLRGVAGDLADITNRGGLDAPASVAAGPPSDDEADN